MFDFTYLITYLDVKPTVPSRGEDEKVSGEPGGGEGKEVTEQTKRIRITVTLPSKHVKLTDNKSASRLVSMSARISFLQNSIQLVQPMKLMFFVYKH